MPKEVIYIIVVFLIALILGVILLFVKKIEKYKNQMYKELVLSSEKYFQELKLKEDKYLEYILTHGASIGFKLSSQGDLDYISKLSLKKRYQFIQDRVVYIFNENLKVKPKIIEIENQSYYQIDKSIKSISILISFEGQSHILANYKVKTKEQGFELIIDTEGVEINE